MNKTAEQIVQHMKDKLTEANADGYVIGMSGGIDCSTVAMLCAKGNIPALLISMPNGASMSPATLEACNKLCEASGYPLVTFDISNECKSIIETGNRYKPRERCAGYAYDGYDIVRTNVPPRIRMVYLYAIAGAKNYLVAGTSNLSEITMGYFTKWGDGASDIEPIAHLTKTEVRELAKELGVPKSIINKAPSADLWAGQTDEKEMGITYADLDRYIRTGDGTPEVVAKVEHAKKINKHKMATLSLD